MYMLKVETARTLEAIGRLGFINPFGEERRALEAQILGDNAVASSAWSRPLEWSLEDPVLRAIQHEAEAQMKQAQARLARGESVSERERELIRLSDQYSQGQGETWIARSGGVELAFWRDFHVVDWR